LRFLFFRLPYLVLGFIVGYLLGPNIPQAPRVDATAE
jgi:hypothetical protein